MFGGVTRNRSQTRNWQFGVIKKEGPSMKGTIGLTAEEQAEMDTWGVWDRECDKWVEGYSDYRGYHERQNLNYNHAINAADQMNGYGTFSRYEARDMEREKSVFEEDRTTPSLEEEIRVRQEKISSLQAELDALLLAQKILGKEK